MEKILRFDDKIKIMSLKCRFIDEVEKLALVEEAQNRLKIIEMLLNNPKVKFYCISNRGYNMSEEDMSKGEPLPLKEAISKSEELGDFGDCEYPQGIVYAELDGKGIFTGFMDGHCSLGEDNSTFASEPETIDEIRQIANTDTNNIKIKISALQKELSDWGVNDLNTHYAIPSIQEMEIGPIDFDKVPAQED